MTAVATTRRCRRCRSALASEQRWCLSCGLAAATVVVPARGWRRPLATAATLAAMALVALVLAFVLLTRNDNPVPATQAAPAPLPAAATQAP